MNVCVLRLFVYFAHATEGCRAKSLSSNLLKFFVSKTNRRMLSRVSIAFLIGAVLMTTLNCLFAVPSIFLTTNGYLNVLRLCFCNNPALAFYTPFCRFTICRRSSRNIRSSSCCFMLSD